MSRIYPQMRFRPPPKLHEKIIKSAAHERRSINAEIVKILEDHFETAEKAPGHVAKQSPDASAEKENGHDAP